MRLLAILACACGLDASGQSPTVTKVSPRAVAPGASTILTLSGSNLKEATHLWTSFGGTATPLTNASGGSSFRVTCPADAFGIGAIQVHGPNGVSDFQLVLIDPLPARGESALETPGAIDGNFRSEEIEYHKFSARAGQELSIEVLAHRLGSQADPVVRVLDRERRELAYCDDDDSVWRDARLQFRAPSNGEYTLAIHDVGYGGGNAFFYRLRVGDFPIRWARFPLIDWSEPGTREHRLVATNESPANPDAAVWFSAMPMLVEHEPNDTAEQAHEFSPPAALNGRFTSGADRDLYRFAAGKGQRLTFFRQSRSLGSPCDVTLRILKIGGELVAESDARSLDEVPFTRRFDEAGTYLLEVRELTGVAPTNAPYRVKVQNWTPYFKLATEFNKLEIKPGESANLKITCERFEYDGEITLESPELNLENSVIAPGKKEIDLPIRLPESTAFLHFTLTGRGTNGFQTAVSTQPALRKTFPLMLNPPPELEGLIAAGRK